MRRGLGLSRIGVGTLDVARAPESMLSCEKRDVGVSWRRAWASPEPSSVDSLQFEGGVAATGGRLRSTEGRLSGLGWTIGIIEISAIRFSGRSERTGYRPQRRREVGDRIGSVWRR